MAVHTHTCIGPHLGEFSALLLPLYISLCDFQVFLGWQDKVSTNLDLIFADQSIESEHYALDEPPLYRSRLPRKIQSLFVADLGTFFVRRWAQS